MSICGKCGVAMASKERKRKNKVYIYYECQKCKLKTSGIDKERLLNAG